MTCEQIPFIENQVPLTSTLDVDSDRTVISLLLTLTIYVANYDLFLGSMKYLYPMNERIVALWEVH